MEQCGSIHLAIGLVEGIITAAVLSFVYEARPELLWNNNSAEKQAKISYRKLLAILTCLVVIIGGGISLIASSNPDGLEWSIARLTGDTEIETNTRGIYEASNKIQEATSVLPDYTFKDSDSIIGTSVSGIVGCSITIVVLLGVGYVVKLTRKKEMVNE